MKGIEEKYYSIRRETGDNALFYRNHEGKQNNETGLVFQIKIQKFPEIDNIYMESPKGQCLFELLNPK